MIADLSGSFGLPGTATNITFGDGNCSGEDIPIYSIDPVTGIVDFTGAPDDVELYYHVTFDLLGDNINCSPNNCRNLGVTPTTCTCCEAGPDPLVLTCPDPAFFICIDDVPPPSLDDISAAGGCEPYVYDIVAIQQTGPCPTIITRTYSVTDDCGTYVECEWVITVDSTGIPGACGGLCD